MKNPRIIVKVSSGAVVAVYSDRAANVSVLDYDNYKCGDMYEDEIEKFQNIEAETKKLKDCL